LRLGQDKSKWVQRKIRHDEPKELAKHFQTKWEVCWTKKVNSPKSIKLHLPLGIEIMGSFDLCEF
jgi:hypothetical protein